MVVSLSPIIRQFSGAVAVLATAGLNQTSDLAKKALKPLLHKTDNLMSTEYGLTNLLELQ